MEAEINRKPDPGIIDHNNKRVIEIKVEELGDELEKKVCFVIICSNILKFLLKRTHHYCLNSLHWLVTLGSMLGSLLAIEIQASESPASPVSISIIF